MAKEDDFRSVICRLIGELSYEKDIIAKRDFGSLALVSERKVRCLLEIERLSRHVTVEELSPVRLPLEQLKNALRESEALLRIHLNAADELCTLLRNVLMDDASDGTYSAQSCQRSER